jgi:alkanesulfonate monooxygenase SsuD/methylene tetrahydromethanopterin reductase-like flavin-dependent oxidoreductase (luciferase family)
MTEYGVLLPRATGPDPGRWFPDLADLARTAEGTGFSSLWVDDPSGPGQDGLEALTLLGGLGLHTSTVTLGVLADLASRPAGLLAKLVTTLDVVTGGRAALGLGLVPGVRRASAATPRSPSRHPDVSELEEAVAVCRALFAGDDVSFTGRHNRLEHARNLPRPLRPGGPILMLGGPPSVLSSLLPSVARYADRLGCTVEAESLGPVVALHRRALEAAGRDTSEARVTWFVPAATGGAGPLTSARWGPDRLPEGVDEVVFDVGAGGPAAVVVAGARLGLDPPSRSAGAPTAPGSAAG